MKFFGSGGIAGITLRTKLPVRAVRAVGREITFEVLARLDTDVEVDYFKNGGILPYVLRKMIKRG